jgi:hypothetical protein
MKKLGFIIVIIGLVLTIFTAITYFTKEKIVDIGPVEITANKPHKVNWSPLLGIAVMGVGGLMIWKFNEK